MYTISSTNLTTGEVKLTSRKNPLIAQEVFTQIIETAIRQGYQVIGNPENNSPFSAVAVKDGRVIFQFDLI